MLGGYAGGLGTGSPIEGRASDVDAILLTKLEKDGLIQMFQFLALCGLGAGLSCL
jgi:hypothetical protein